MAFAARSIQHLGYAPAARGPGWALAGQDGGQSIDLGDRRLFVFSDTLLARTGRLNEPLPATFNRDNAVFLANCAAVSSECDFLPALAGLDYYSANGWPREIIPATVRERLAGHRFWPEHGVLVDGKVYLFYIGIRHFDQSSAWGFQGIGSGIAVLDPGSGDCQRLKHAAGWSFWPVLGDDLHFGTQVLQEDSLLYVFSSRRRGLQSHALLARVPSSGIADRGAYEYLSSCRPEWSPRFEESCDLAPAANEYSVSFNAYLNGYLMVYVDSYSKQLCFRTAPAPWGPYSAAQVSGVLPHHEQSGIISLGFEHPHFREENGRKVYVSYCQPGFTQNSLLSLRFL
jgi:hypothetical protein